MPSVKSLDGLERTLSETAQGMRCRDTASKLQKFNTLVTDQVLREELILISEWLTFMNGSPWEVAIVQDSKSKALRLVNGKASNSHQIAAMVGAKYLRPNEIFIVHIHPVTRSLRSHVEADLRTATDTLEGALDWSNVLLCYDRTRLYNQPDFRSGVESYFDAGLAAHHGKIPFLRGDYITGYRHFDNETNRANCHNPFRAPS